MRLRKIRIERDRMLEIAQRFLVIFFREPAFNIDALQIEVVGLLILGRLLSDSRAILRQQTHFKLLGDVLGHIALDRKNVRRVWS